MHRILFLLLSSILSFGLLGQDSLKTKEATLDNWNFRIGPYFWFIGIDATLQKPPVPSNLPEYSDRDFNISKTFSEVKNSIKFAFLINTDYQKNRWLGVLNATSLILEGDAVTPKELIVEGVNYRFAFAFGEAMAGYQVISKPKFKLDMLGGAKVFYSSISGRGEFVGDKNFEDGRTITWVEPIIATRLKYIANPRIEFLAYIDYGPIRSAEELTNQWTINANFLLNKWLYVSPGYRYWLFRKTSDESIFNGQFYGFYFRVGAQF
jgi:hypothetical protein